MGRALIRNTYNECMKPSKGVQIAIHGDGYVVVLILLAVQFGAILKVPHFFQQYLLRTFKVPRLLVTLITHMYCDVLRHASRGISTARTPAHTEAVAVVAMFSLVKKVVSRNQVESLYRYVQVVDF